ncbi:DNA polymerase IV [Parasegetibacter sp. NRK P23]|uniref:DNA polymerase IV n=1 Tax=Parasegetibacter sp. NRK P23 TaxID=2942999 RepID=UPI0020435F71|nr:DNA polymerase IV [Parasegetibacter sp. NRK P23]MCM5527099.1 DNA polymerase IV [Parasegetibacter sp. NRK P23]
MFLQENRHIAHFDLDAFFVAVECKKNSKLVGKPVLVGGSSDRAVVAACSYETRKFGIHSAMPMKLAKRLCPEAIIIKGDMESYSQHSRDITNIIASKVPLFEKASIDEFYIDLTGMDKFFGCKKYTDELRMQIIKESGLSISYGLASNKLISKVATNEIKPNGQLEVPPGNEKPFLAPLRVNKIPGVGKETTRLLVQMGVETIHTLSQIPIEMLHNLLGKSGTELWKRANGIDDTPVVPYREQKSISTENTFHTDTTDMRFLETELIRMTESIGHQLREQNKLTGCITVKIRYSNFDTVTRQSAIPFTASDHLLIKRVKELFYKLYDKRLLVRLIGVRFTELVPGNYQINLFDDTQEMIRLYQAIDGIKMKYGVDYLTRGASAR